jgi:DNA invertase Pin-like site-specific DNA recombinase
MAARKTAAPSTITIALIYTRVSTDEQAREGVSLDAQLREDRQYVARQPGWVIGGEYQDVMSGTRDDRPDYQALLTEARRLRAEGHPVAVVVAALDRFGRKLLERVRCREELKALGIPVHSVREGGEVGDLVANILASVAQEEVRLLGQRVSAARRHLQANGWFPVGRLPWGYLLRDATPEERAAGAPRRVLDVDLGTAPFVREAYTRVAGGESIRAVATWAARLPDAARGGRVLTYQAVRLVLSTPTYIGRAERDAPPGHWPALVDVQTWDSVQARIKSHQQVPHQASGRYLLTGFVRCRACGMRMYGSRRRVGRTDTYICMASVFGAKAPNPHCRWMALIPPVDRAVLTGVGALLEAVAGSTPELVSRLRQEWRGLQATDTIREQSGRRKPWEQAAEQARRRLTNAAVLFADGQIDKTGYELLRDKARADLEGATAELERLGNVINNPGLPDLDVVVRQAGGWATALASSVISAQRDVLAVLIEQVIPERSARGQYNAEIRWTPLGEALRHAAAVSTTAA